MKINLDWIIRNLILILPCLVLLAVIKFQIKKNLQLYFFDGSFEKPDQLPTNKKRNLLGFSKSLVYSGEAVLWIGFFIVIGSSSEEEELKIPTHFIDYLLIVFVVTFVISYYLFKEYFNMIGMSLKTN